MLVTPGRFSAEVLTLTNGIPPRKAMVMAGEDAVNDVDEEVFGNDGAERHEAQVASAGDRRAVADADQAGQLDISGEAKTARILRTPKPPTDAARMAHNADTCSIQRLVPDLCCKSWTKFSAQTSCGGQDGGYPAEIPNNLQVHSNSGREQNSAMYHIRGMCARKSGYADLTKEILRHFEAYGFLNPVIIQCDQEMSIIDVCRKVARERNARTVFTIRAKNKSSEQRVCRSSARTHSGTRTMLQDTNRDEHWHTAFSNFTCHSICHSDLYSQDSQCDPTAAHHSNICSELHMCHLCACLVNRYSR